ncbi:MAG: ATP-binding protein [Vicinamibacteria bacterium]|nr:ATP-binding protein [Vicinamibacteria bacterium]
MSRSFVINGGGHQKLVNRYTHAMEKGLYIGKAFDPAAATIGERLEIDPTDLLTHGLIVGMTGSGKTGLACALIEEVLLRGTPVIAIDPKGDIGNLLLLFEKWEARQVVPWIDADAARRDGKSVDVVAEETAASWRAGLAEWGLGSDDAIALRRAREGVIFTPGSSAGVPLNILQSLDAPRASFDSMEEDLRDEIGSLVRGLLRLAGVDADPVQSTEGVFLANLIERAWREGRDLSLEALVAFVADPPFEKIGALPLARVYPRKAREKLLIALNNLLAAPAFEAWRRGEPLDVERLLRSDDGRPRLSIIYTAHLGDEERLFVTALLFDRIKTWMRRQSGTGELRALIYMDEIYGYFPPHPADPPTKRPLLTLLKQARAQGLGVVLATQNPVDLDYKGLANMGMWLVGRLQTEQDRARLKDGLLGVGAKAKDVDALLGAARKRVFLLHDIHRSAPCLLHSRWTLSFLRGPLTRPEVAALMKERPSPEADESRVDEQRDREGQESSAAPLLPPPLRHHYLDRHGYKRAAPHIFVKYAVKHAGLGERIELRAFALAGKTPAEAFESESFVIGEDALREKAPEAMQYEPLPEYLHSQGVKGLERALRERLPDKLAVRLFVDPWSKELSRPGEERREFADRLQETADMPKLEKLRKKIDGKKLKLQMYERDLSGRRTEKWAALGGALLSNLGLFTGRKRRITGATTVLTKDRMENAAEARVESMKAEIVALGEEVDRLKDVDPSRFEERLAIPSQKDVKILRFDIVWVH